MHMRGMPHQISLFRGRELYPPRDVSHGRFSDTSGLRYSRRVELDPWSASFVDGSTVLEVQTGGIAMNDEREVVAVLKIVQMHNDGSKLSCHDKSREWGIETRYPAFQDLRSCGYGYSRVLGIRLGDRGAVYEICEH